jgi:hypothetical protein
MRPEWRRAIVNSRGRLQFKWFVHANWRIEQGWRVEHEQQRKRNYRFVQTRYQRLVIEEEIEESKSEEQ